MISANELKQKIKISELANRLGLTVNRSNKVQCYNSQAHNNGDRNPSLSLYEANNTYKCFSCGKSGSVIDFYMGYKNVDFKEAVSDLKKMYSCDHKFVGTDISVNTKSSREYTFESIKGWHLNGKTFDTYSEYFGEKPYIKVRLRNPNNRKDKQDLFFTQIEEGKFIKGRKCPPVFYNQDELKTKPTDIVCYTEGEGCVNAMKDLGFLAITAGSASVSDKTFTPDMISKLKGRKVVIFSDNDPVGYKSANKIEKLITHVVESVKIVDIVSEWNELFNEIMPEKADIKDLIEKYKPTHDDKKLKDVVYKIIENVDLINIETLPTAKTDITESNNSATPIHLIDLERTSFVGCLVSTDIIIGGIGEVFHVPKEWKIDCGSRSNDTPPCTVCPTTVQLNTHNSRSFLDFCRMSDSQKIGKMRTLSGCERKGKVDVTEHTTITELLALPIADNKLKQDYRDKIIYFIGNLKSTNQRYRAAGYVIAEPKKQKASLIVHELKQLETDVNKFILTDNMVEQFKHLQPQTDTLETYLCHKKSITSEITANITKIYGDHRERILFAILLTYHSPINLNYNGAKIKGVIDTLIAGDTGEGKTTMYDRFKEAVGFGNITSASTSSRTGILYHLDSKVNDKRILRWGAYPLSHGELLGIDEAQKLPQDQWDEFTTARSEGVLKVERTIRSEHPCNTRLITFANPVNNKPMSQFQYGIEVVAPGFSFLRPADLRRFDILAIVNSDDQDISEVIKPTNPVTGNISTDLLRNSILWAWSRKRDDFVYGENSMDAIRDLSKALINRYKTTEIPLVVNDIQEKIARIAFSIATFFHSTDDSHEKVILKPLHVVVAGKTLEEFYDHPNCRFDQYTKVIRLNSLLTDQEYNDIKSAFFKPNGYREDVIATEEIFNSYLTSDTFSKSDIEVITGLSKNPLNERIQKLRKFRLIISQRGGYKKTARMINFLDRWMQEKEGLKFDTLEQVVV